MDADPAHPDGTFIHHLNARLFYLRHPAPAVDSRIKFFVCHDAGSNHVGLHDDTDYRVEAHSIGVDRHRFKHPKPSDVGRPAHFFGALVVWLDYAATIHLKGDGHTHDTTHALCLFGAV